MTHLADPTHETLTYTTRSGPVPDAASHHTGVAPLRRTAHPPETVSAFELCQFLILCRQPCPFIPFRLTGT